MWKTIRSSKLLRSVPLVLTVLLFLVPPAAADPLDGPRADGLVGERYDGYAQVRVGSAPGDVKALVRTINRQRRDFYDRIAKQENISATEVGKVYAAKIQQSAPRGYWFLTQGGSWVRKF